jgi:hypothetical protein
MPEGKVMRSIILEDGGVREATSTVSAAVSKPADVDSRPGQQRRLCSGKPLHSAEPQRAVSLTPLRRSKSGNRVNDIMAGQDSAKADDEKIRTRRRIALEDCQAKKRSAFALYVMVVATTLVLLLTIGLAGERKVLLEPRPSVAGDYVVSGGRAGVGNTGTPVISAPVVRRDDDGRPVEIRASDPRSVLYGFCSAREGSGCEPVELAWTEPRHPEVRIGVFRGFSGVQAIRIHRDPLSGQWLCGNGRNPIHDSPVDDLRLSRTRIPI